MGQCQWSLKKKITMLVCVIINMEKYFNTLASITNYSKVVDLSQARLYLVSGIHTLHHHRRWNFHYFCKARHNYQARSIRERPVPHFFSQQTSFLKVSLKNQSRLKVEATLRYTTPPFPWNSNFMIFDATL